MSEVTKPSLLLIFSNTRTKNKIRNKNKTRDKKNEAKDCKKERKKERKKTIHGEKRQKDRENIRMAVKRKGRESIILLENKSKISPKERRKGQRRK